MKQNIPKIRFKKFDGEWEEQKLGKLGDFKSGIGFPDNEQGGNSGVPFFKISDMSNVGNEVEMLTSNNYVTQEQIIRKKWKVIDDVPAIIFAKVGAALMLNRKRLVNQPFLIDNNTMSFIFNKTWDINFGLAIFQTLYLPQFAQVGALPSYNASDIAAIKVTLPDKVEQSAIGTLFQTLDELLSAYKDNLANYQAFKATMLSKMFPKAGQTTPEIRLDGSDEMWEEKKLSEIAIFNPKAQLPKVFKYVDLESVVGTNLISYRIEKIEAAPSRAQRLAQKGDIFFQTVRPYQKNNYLFSTNETDWVFSTGYAQLRPKIDNRFLFNSMQRDEFVNTVLLNCTGTSYPAINSKDLSKLKVYVPNIDEQRAIGAFFANLDGLIASQQAKIAELETLKKKLLQDMFV